MSQLRYIHDYIAQDSPIYAKRVTEALVDRTLALETLPLFGRTEPELNDDHVRELALYSYRIFYEIKTTHTEVLAVIHKRRNLKPEELLHSKY